LTVTSLSSAVVVYEALGSSDKSVGLQLSDTPAKLSTSDTVAELIRRRIIIRRRMFLTKNFKRQ